MLLFLVVASVTPGKNFKSSSLFNIYLSLINGLNLIKRGLALFLLLFGFSS